MEGNETIVLTPKFTSCQKMEVQINGREKS